MDHSKSSFPDSDDSLFVTMDTTSYESLVAATKQALTSDISRETVKATFFTFFTALLEDSSTCISQNLDLVTELLLKAEVCINKLSKYLDDAVFLLQLLSNFIKTVIESVSMACCSMNTFPATTGHIIVAVFTHCKDSESLYGNNLGSVEKQLKDLFRNCHELQLTYLMILEKHFIFDLTEKEEKNIIIEALDINLKIGEIVQSLDVKTMAEQWKAYTAICEKYSAFLSDTNIFQDCTQVLCMSIRNYMNTAVEKNQDEKVLMRSLKVASFTIKILLKTCNIFRQAIRKDYANVVDLMAYLHIAHLGMTVEKTQFENLVVIPSECLLKELMSDEAFGNSLLNSNEEKSKNEETLLGFLFIVMSAMKCLTQGQQRSKTVTKTSLINYLYNVLPHCHVWSKLELTLKSESSAAETDGLFERLLIHTAALAFTLNSEEFSVLERHMAEAILGTDCYSALFSANLWELMASHVSLSPQLLFNQLVWLCTMYKKLESHKMFNRSPQRVHLSCTIGRLFEVMENDDKLKICKQFRIHDDDNVSLWTTLGVRSLPEEVQCAADEAVAEKLKSQFQCFSRKGPEGLEKLIKLISLAATCTFTNTRGIEDCILQAWSKTCLKHHFTIKYLYSSTVWFYDYLQALVSLTDSMWHGLRERSTSLIKMLYLISSLIQQCSSEFKLLLTNTLCKLATCDISKSKGVEDNFTRAFTCLFHSEDIVRNILFITLREHRRDNNLDRILSYIEDNELQESWSNIKNGQDCSDSDLKAIDFKYSHKCFESRNIIELSGSSDVSELRKVPSSNFDFADLDDLFDNDINSEPVSKKVKLSGDEAEDIIKRLETDAALLFKVKENVFTAEYRNRIQNVCNKLRNTIH